MPYLEQYKFETQKKEKNEFLNKLLEYKTTAKSENKNSEQDKLDESDSLLFDDKINFYEVQKKNIINYMTPINSSNNKIEKVNKNGKIIKENKQKLIRQYSNNGSNNNNYSINSISTSSNINIK